MQIRQYFGDSPWGAVDQHTAHEKGIYFVSTASHGGFFVPTQTNRAISESFRANATGKYLGHTGAWYEEDCAANIVAYFFPSVAPNYNEEQTIAALRNWYPDAWERFSGETIPEGKSYTKDRRLFDARHIHDWVVISAVAMDDTWAICTATIGGLRINAAYANEKTFLVSLAEYRSRSNVGGFIIDTTRHAPAAQ